jgi:hypothetical protein
MTARRYSVWSLSRADGRGLVVAEGTELEAQAAATRRTEAAARQGLAGSAVFIALPKGRQPTMADIPPLPEPAPASPEPAPVTGASGKRTLDSVAGDLVHLACAGISAKGDLQERTAARVYELVEEARRLAVADQRQATARAWSAWLSLVMTVKPPEAGGKSLLEDVLDLEPGLREQFAAVMGGARRG